MNLTRHWTATLSSAALFGLAGLPAGAFTDENAELKEAAADRGVRVVVTGKAGIPRRTVWVPPPAKSLDGFKPVYPEDRLAANARPQRLASASPAASASR